MACRIISLAIFLCLCHPLVSPAALLTVQVEGVAGEVADNVLARLAINQQKERPDLPEGAIRRLHRQAEKDIRTALAPFGYYNPVISTELNRAGDGWLAKYLIEPGPLLEVSRVTVRLIGPGHHNAALIERVEDFPIRTGDRLDQALYDQEKKNLLNTAFVAGFLEAKLVEKSILVHRGNNSAEIRLTLDTGRQYLFGKTRSEQEVLHDDLLDRFLPYAAGDPYNPKKLFELQSILYRTDYFSEVVVQGKIDRATDLAVPVQVDLVAPTHRNVYSLGAGYATDTGVRGKIDWKNRLLNSRGHRSSAQLQLAELENILTLNYQIPGEDPRFDSHNQQLSYQDKTWENTTTRLLSAQVNRAYAGPRYSYNLGLELRDEVYDIGSTSGDSTLLIPSIHGGGVYADAILHTRNGLQASVGVLGAVDGVLADASFIQTVLSGKAIVTPFANWRLLGRGSLGVTFVDSIDSLPPSLRFYAGGDNSIRGYRYKSIGTRDVAGEVVGGRYMVVGSLEVERLLGEYWSLATFYDSGTASDDLSLNFYRGAGLGVRFRLPFGQIRLDLASAVSEEGYPLRLHLTVGGDL